MNRRHFVILVVWMCLLTVVVSGCRPDQLSPTFSYEACQDIDNVKQIEICTYQDGRPVGTLGTITPLILLTNEQIHSFWEDIHGLKCKETMLFDTPTGYGDIIFLITYQDGEKEIISLQWIGHIAADGYHTETLKYFDPIELSKVFAKYGDPALLAEKSEFFSHYWNLAEEESNKT
ncbi:MAG: hypothetical protein IKC69_03025 [Clostridia bacterium]|nr:hypothetical protein [Clostridia bacterium]